LIDETACSTWHAGKVRYPAGELSIGEHTLIVGQAGSVTIRARYYSGSGLKAESQSGCLSGCLAIIRHCSALFFTVHHRPELRFGINDE
jgi:hypothetical protein